MANPNIVSVASIYGKTVYDTDIAASAASLVSNAASAGKFKGYVSTTATQAWENLN